MSDALTLERDGAGWPWRSASRLVEAGGMRWHVQVLGEGPPVLLLHGTGASAHSWHRVMGLLKNRFTVVVPDLPGHAFSENPGNPRLTLPDMAAKVAELMDALGGSPRIVVGHSAGAAIAIRAILDGRLTPEVVISVNGALRPMGGIAGGLFSPLAKLVAMQPWIARLLSWRAGSRSAVERMLRDTGSALAAEDIDLYVRLFRNLQHDSATLAMMANWDLVPLVHDLRRLAVPLVLAVGDNDKAIPPADAEFVSARVAQGHVIHLPALGHLAHEERPDLIADLINLAAAEAGISRGTIEED